MFINKAKNGNNNICGRKIKACRTDMKISQKKLADRLQLHGLDVDKNAIQRIEAGKRFVTDIELVAISTVLDKDIVDLLDLNEL